MYKQSLINIVICLRDLLIEHVEWLFTNYPFRFISKDRDIYGSGFDSDKSFEKITFLDVSGYVTVEE